MKIPKDPNNPKWSFCFNGIPFLVNLNSKNYQERRSRNVSNPFSLIVQRRDSFDSFIKDEFRIDIRNRIGVYDKISASKYLGSYDDLENLEWKQFHLPKNNLIEQIERCPFKTDKNA